MVKPQPPADLEQMLERLGAAERGDEDQVAVREMVSEVGRRSFGPMLLVPGIITLLPIIGDIPGVPTLMAAWVLMVAVQLLFHSQHFWLPKWLLQRSVSREKLNKSLHGLRPVARFIDRLTRPRLTFLTRGSGAYAVALVCILIALAMPPMEVVPFTANGAGLALTLFGLSLMAHDGLMALLAFAATLASFALVIYGLI